MRLPLLVLLSLLVMGLFGCRQDIPAGRYLLLKGYVGPIRVEYSIAGAPELTMEDGRYFYPIPATGRMQTSSALPEGWHELDDFYYVSGAVRQRLPVENEPYPVGTQPPAAMVRGGTTGSGTNTPVTQWWFIGTDKQFQDYVKKHGDWIDW